MTSRSIMMCDGLKDCGHYWFIADYRGEKPWEAVRPYDAALTQRMIQAGKMRLLQGPWPQPGC